MSQLLNSAQGTNSNTISLNQIQCVKTFFMEISTKSYAKNSKQIKLIISLHLYDIYSFGNLV